ncbi:TolC family protein [bacterium]|nr:TolC family protein [bacterium]
MKKILIFILLLVAPKTWALTLDDVIKRVANTHPAIAAKQFEAKATKAKKGAEAWLNDPQAMIEREEGRQTNYKISQEIPFPTTLITKNKSIGYEYKSKLGDLSETERTKIFEAKKTYYELVANQKQINHQSTVVASYDQLINSLKQQYETTADKKLPASGDMEKPSTMPISGMSDILMAKTKRAVAETNLHDLKHQKGFLEAKLNLLMGQPASKPLDALSEPPLKRLGKSDSELEQVLLNNNATLASLKWMVQKYKADQSLARQSVLPTVTPEWTYNKIDDEKNAQTFGIGFNVPLWLNRNASQMKVATLEKYKTQKEFEAKTLDLKTELYYLTNHAREHYSIINTYRSEILPTARSATNMAQTAFEVSLIPANNLMEKLVDYNEMAKMYWDMWADYQTEYALLEQLVGENL